MLHSSRRDDKLRIQNGWLCHLAPEIIRQLSPDTEEDKLPFSKHSDVFALGYVARPRLFRAPALAEGHFPFGRERHMSKDFWVKLWGEGSERAVVERP